MFVLAIFIVIAICVRYFIVKKTLVVGNVKVPEKILIKPKNGIPKNTTLEFDNGKYVPVFVPGYESKADYPDNFWFHKNDMFELEAITKEKQ